MNARALALENECVLAQHRVRETASQWHTQVYLLGAYMAIRRMAAN